MTNAEEVKDFLDRHDSSITYGSLMFGLLIKEAYCVAYGIAVYLEGKSAKMQNR